MFVVAMTTASNASVLLDGYCRRAISTKKKLNEKVYQEKIY
jgi:hypothetical protein